MTVTDDLLIQMLTDADAVTPQEAELLELSQLAETQLFLESRCAELEEMLNVEKEKLRLIVEQYLPEAMMAVGIKKFTLKNDYTITVEDDVFTSIRKNFLDQAFKWLDANGLGGVIKDDVTVKFGRGEDVSGLLDFCKDYGLNVEQKLSVHASTLKALVREQMAKGVQFPSEYFSIAPVKKAVIKK